MKLKTVLFIFLTGVAVGSAGTWFWMQEPERRDELLQEAREHLQETAESVSEAIENKPFQKNSVVARLSMLCYGERKAVKSGRQFIFGSPPQ